MSSPVSLTAILTLNPGSDQKFIELFDACARYSKENEPFVWVYQLKKGKIDPNGEVTDLVIHEVYENQALMEKHVANETVQQLIKGSKALVKETKIIFLENQVATGFSSRL